ncbi:GIY-YIG nuclease family protein [Tardiphaga sp. 37S4]|uniref:GIY-YIG nuclease family protein n=1 Tax=Tardiphaga sp. 37S4 TaxID=1404741 RepID=UPI001E4300B2|nr:GIY-YIG nuclease family protein [Tardiphaga sp. 37S4]UFS77203.1 GIY-YIG nuclease family protein [Tardiphaga sp. 37S4]
MAVNPDLLPKDSGVYLYLICGHGREHEPLSPVKIGITANVAARLASVQTGQHTRLSVLAAFTTPNRDIARTLESQWHRHFAKHRLEGEWFDVDPITALEVMCLGWRHYFQNVPEFINFVDIPFYEREAKVMRAWREYYAANSNVVSIKKAD